MVQGGFNLLLAYDYSCFLFFYHTQLGAAHNHFFTPMGPEHLYMMMMYTETWRTSTKNSHLLPPRIYLIPAILSLIKITENNQHIKILPKLPKMPPNLPAYLLSALLLLLLAGARHHASPAANATYAGQPVYLWPLPKSVSSGSRTLTVDPDLALDPQGPGGRSPAVAEAFQRCRGHVFAPWAHAARAHGARYDVTRLTVVVASANDTVRSVVCSLLAWLLSSEI